MKKYFYLVLGLLILSQSTAFAQCGTDEYNQRLLENKVQPGEHFSDYIEAIRAFDYANATPEKGKKATRVIPVVFHVVHLFGEENISKEQIEDQMRIINEDFQRLNADTINTRSEFVGRASNFDIEFKLAHIAPDGSCTEGITRTYHQATVEDYTQSISPVKTAVKPWDRNKYLNIWVVSEIKNDNPNNTILGYAQFPGLGASTDGVVIIHDRVGTIGTASIGDKGRTLTHEIGHWLGLYHPFQGGCSTNNNRTDRVGDTPPVAEPSYGCPTGNNSCSNDNPDEIDMVENYMDYSNGNCMNAFTNGQKTRVDNTLAGTRANIISGNNLNATGVNITPDCAPIADFWVDEGRFVICPGQSLNFSDMSYNGEADSRLWTFDGGTPSQATFKDVEVTYNTPGVYKVKLEVSNGNGSDSKERLAFITVLPEEAIVKAPFGEDFSLNNLGAWWLEKDNANDGWKRITSTGYSGNESLIAHIDNGTANGSRYSLIMPPVDLTTHSTPVYLNYKYAYAQREATASEILFIMVSTNCGEDWATIRAFNAINGLETAPDQPGWTPSSQSDWGLNEIDVSQFASQNNVMFRFDVLSQSGNSVFIDDIAIAQFHLSTRDLISNKDLLIAPNPATNQVKYEYLPGASSIKLCMTDLSGRVIYQKTVNQNSGIINTEMFSNGVYLLQATIDGVTISKKLIITK